MVPEKFIIKTNHIYPPYNDMIFEHYFYEKYKNIELKRKYLPILWTNFYLSRGNGDGDMADLQLFLNQLDRNEKYFTIIQYDDGILQNINNLDILVFGSGGGGQKKVELKNLGVEIPLLCKPNPNINKNRQRNILAGFIGALNGRHEVRDIMYKELKNQTGFVIDSSHGYNTFSDVMERSIFSLSPRGYGATSFRICESLQYGSIPVYIYDNPWIPWKKEFNFEDIGILISKELIKKIPEILRSKTQSDIDNYIKKGEEIYKEYFDYDGCAKQIIKKINE